MNIQLERLRRLPRVSSQVWQIAVERMPMWICEKKKKPYRPVTAICADATTGQVHFTPPQQPEMLSQTAALDALALLALESADPRVPAMQCLPGKIQVKDASAMDALRAPLAELGITVELRDTLPAVKGLIEYLEDQTGFDGPGDPGLMSVRGMTIERIAAFADAAAAFYKAKPWKFEWGDTLYAVTPQPIERGFQLASLMGGMGEVFGIGFMSSLEQVDAMNDPTDFWAALKTKVWSVSFDPIQKIPLDDADLWLDHDLPLAKPDAYPVLLARGRGLKGYRPKPKTLTFVEGVLRAYATITDKDFDTESWTRDVQTFDGPLTLRFSEAERFG